MYDFEAPLTDTRLKTLLMDLDGKMPARMNKALEVLITAPEEKIVDALLKEVRKKNKTLRMNAVIILGHKDDDKRVERTLIKVLREGNNKRTTKEICRALGNIGKSREAVIALLELTGNGNTEVTVKARAAIGKIRKRMNVLEKRRDLAHIRQGWDEDLVTMAEIKTTMRDIETRDRTFMKNSGELLEKMKEFSMRKRKGAALRRAEKTFKEIKEKRARA